MSQNARSLRDTYVTATRVTGYKREEDSGAWVFVILVTWSDKSRYEIYRRYADFFTFQDTLLDLFPTEAGKYDKHDRCIPYLPTSDNVLKLFGKYFSSSRLESRLQTINYYCETILIKLNDSISRCNFVLRFFGPQPGDQQLLDLTRPPSFHPQNIPASSQFEEYRVIAKFEGDTDKQLSLSLGESVYVINKKEEAGWWYVARGEDQKKCGWVPGSFLSPLVQNIEDYLDDPEEWEDPIEEAVELYVSIADYNSEDPNQLSFLEGDEVKVIDKDDDGWWLCIVGSRTGWLPSTYIEPLKTVGSSSTEPAETTKVVRSDQQDDDIEDMYWVQKEYKATVDDEISLPESVQVKILSTNSSGWWTVEFDKRTGLAPATHLSKTHPKDMKDAVINYHQRGVGVKRRTCLLRRPPPRKGSVRKLSRKYQEQPERKYQLMVECPPILEVTGDEEQKGSKDQKQEVSKDQEQEVVEGEELESRLIRSSPVLVKKPVTTRSTFSHTLSIDSPTPSPKMAAKLSSSVTHSVGNPLNQQDPAD